MNTVEMVGRQDDSTKGFVAVVVLVVLMSRYIFWGFFVFQVTILTYLFQWMSKIR